MLERRHVGMQVNTFCNIVVFTVFVFVFFFFFLASLSSPSLKLLLKIEFDVTK